MEIAKEEMKMNKKGYAATCSKYNSTNIKYDYQNTRINSNVNKASTLVKCVDCGYETTEEK